MALFSRRSVIVVLIALAAALGGQAAQAKNPLAYVLAGVRTVQLSIGTSPNQDPAAPCALSRGSVERRGVEMLQAAGLETLTIAEAMERHRRNGEAISRGLEALRSGQPLPGPGSEEARQRRASIDFMIHLPRLMVVFSTAPAPVEGEPICALAVSATFWAAPEGGRSRLGATGREVTGGGVLLWERPARAFAARESELPAAAIERLEAIVGAFIADWRQANGR